MKNIMKDTIISLCSGLIGVLLTIGYQYFFPPNSTVIVSNNNKEVETISKSYEELSAENDSLTAKIDSLTAQNTKYYEELKEATNKIDELQLQISNIPDSGGNGLLGSTSTSKRNTNNVSIREISEFYSDGIEHREETITDNIGNSYDGYTFMSAGDFWVELEGSVVYRNDNQYNRFYGRVIVSQSGKNDEDCGWIKIYGDDILLFDTGTMGRGIEPADFDIDISMYSKIKIDFKSGEWSKGSLQYPECYLVNTYFEEK